MRFVCALMAGFFLLTMAGCGIINPFPQHVYSTPPAERTPSYPKREDPKTRPYTVLGQTYYPLTSADGYDEVGLASWYGRDFHGKKTANGQTYNMYGVSAAHKTLPLGTKVEVTNLENSRSVVLVINDRGPFVNERIIDLSYGAAKKLGTVERGVAKVRVTAIQSAPAVERIEIAAVKRFHVRVGAFAVRDNAERLHQRLRASGYSGANIVMVSRDGRILHIVQAGSFSNRDQAEAVLEELKGEFPTSYIIS